MKIGVDIAKISRFKNKDALALKILSKAEHLSYLNHPLPSQFLAGRFAAKEAFIKAWQTPPLPDLSLIEVRVDELGTPSIFFKGQTYALSISHDGAYVVATVLV